MQVRDDYRSLDGPEKAAILMLSLDEEHAAQTHARRCSRPSRINGLHRFSG